MNRLAKLQLFGPFVLSITIIGAELAAYLLAMKPSSMVAWYLNMEIFGVFQRSYYVLNQLFGVAYFQLLFVAIPMLLLVSIAVASRRPFLIAGVSHIGFIYAFFLAYTWYIFGLPSMPAASLAQSQYTSVMSWSHLSLIARPQVLILMALLVTSLLSLAGSHVHYLRAVRNS